MPFPAPAEPQQRFQELRGPPCELRPPGQVAVELFEPRRHGTQPTAATAAEPLQARPGLQRGHSQVVEAQAILKKAFKRN